MKHMVKIAVIIGGAYLAVGAGLFAMQRSYIYFPATQDFYQYSSFPPASAIIHKGTRMYARQSTNDWIVIYHENAGSACDRHYYLNYFNQEKYSYLVVEYAGYSGDPGPPSQQALIKNVESAADYLQSRKAASVTVIGESLGAALAAYHSQLSAPDKLLFISPFDSLTSVSRVHYWYYPTWLMLKDKYPSQEWAKNADNVLVIHGENDSIIPIYLSKKLFESISGSNKKFIAVTGAGHNDILFSKEADAAIREFLRLPPNFSQTGLH